MRTQLIRADSVPGASQARRSSSALGPAWLHVLLRAAFVALASCTSAPGPLELESLDPAQDQWRIAGYYSQQARDLHQKADEMSVRARAYERLFGPDSDWVAGARLLAQFYEEAAREREREAGQHVGSGAGHAPARLGEPWKPQYTPP